MTTKTEYGPPIAVNGKRPEWLGAHERVQFTNDCDYSDVRFAEFIAFSNVVSIRLPADHPYYQSVEYKAWVCPPCQPQIGEDGQIGAGQLPMTEAEMIAALEAAGYTVTPPDPLAADREFLAGLYEAWKMPNTAVSIRNGGYDERLTPFLDYLRQNKGRL